MFYVTVGLLVVFVLYPLPINVSPFCNHRLIDQIH